MNKKSLTNLALVLAVVSMASYFNTMFPLVITAFGALTIAIFAVKDTKTTAIVLDPIITAGCISLTNMVFSVLQSICNSIINLCENVNYNFTNGLNDTFRIINLIFIFVMIVAIILAIIFTAKGKRFPLFSKITNNILDINE